jgi:D-alanyl-D-alanine carboxypeptidase
MRQIMTLLVLALLLAGCGQLALSAPLPQPPTVTPAATPTPIAPPTVSPPPTTVPTPQPSLTPTASPAPTALPILPPIEWAAALVDLREAGVAQARPGQRLRPEPVADLIGLLEAAHAAGFSLEVHSAYRSYIDQEATFEKWIAHEQRLARQNGQPISRATAMDRASAYSAAPGRSEHQTGLAVDLLPVGAPDIGFAIPSDLQVWLAYNAHLYGWVQSYPVKTDQAGYSITAHLIGHTSEPWHWRWQGREAAAALFERGYLDPAGPALPPALPLICDLDHDPCVPLEP